MAKRTLLLPVVVAILSGAAVGLVVSGVETTYQAAASVRINPLVGVREIDRLRAAAGLDQVEERQDLPFIPADRGVFERVLRRVNRELRPAEPLDEDDATVSDSQSLLVLEHFKPPLRRLTATARATSRAEAARAANLILSVYLDERRRIYDRLLAETRRRLLRRARRPATPAARPRLLEAADATRVISQLDDGLFTHDRRPARPPEEALLPHVTRDVVVAAIIGGLMGWLLQRAAAARRRRPGSPPPPRPSRLAA